MGIVVLRRVYCGKAASIDWQETASRFALQLRHPLASASGKNATDMTLVIEALDLAHPGLLDGFCLASCDRDFTPLAVRLRQGGFRVFGFGKTDRMSPSFIAACDDFRMVDCGTNARTG